MVDDLASQAPVAVVLAVALLALLLLSGLRGSTTSFTPAEVLQGFACHTTAAVQAGP